MFARDYGETVSLKYPQRLCPVDNPQRTSTNAHSSRDTEPLDPTSNLTS